MAFERKREAKEREMQFLRGFTLPSKKWFEKGVKQASTSKCDQVSAEKVLSYAGVQISDVETASDHIFDPLVKEHVHIECQYSHYI